MESKYSVINKDGIVNSVLENDADFKAMFQEIVGLSIEELDELEFGYLLDDNFKKFTGIIETILVEQKCPSEQVSSTAKFIVCAYLYLNSSIIYENHEMRCQYYVYSVFMGLRNFGNCNLYFSRLVLTSVVKCFILNEKGTRLVASLYEVYNLAVTALFQHQLAEEWKNIFTRNITPLPLSDKVLFTDGHEYLTMKADIELALSRLADQHFMSFFASKIQDFKSTTLVEDLDEESKMKLERLELKNGKYFDKQRTKEDAKAKLLKNSIKLEKLKKAITPISGVKKTAKAETSQLPEPTTFSELLTDPEVLNLIRSALAELELTNASGEIIQKGCWVQIIIYEFCDKNKLIKNHIGLREKFAKLISKEFNANVTGRTLDNKISPNKAAKEKTAKLAELLTEKLLAHKSTN